MKTALIAILLCALLSTARSAEKLDVIAFARAADQITLYSIHPSRIETRDEHGNRISRHNEQLHGHDVLGKIATTDPKIREELRKAVIATLDTKPKETTRTVTKGAKLIETVEEFAAPALCYDPRHAVCLRKGDYHLDILICFECDKAVAHYWADDRGSILGAGSGHSVQLKEDPIDFNPAGREILNRLLDDRRIERDMPKAEK